MFGTCVCDRGSIEAARVDARPLALSASGGHLVHVQASLVFALSSVEGAVRGRGSDYAARFGENGASGPIHAIVGRFRFSTMASSGHLVQSESCVMAIVRQGNSPPRSQYSALKLPLTNLGRLGGPTERTMPV